MTAAGNPAHLLEVRHIEIADAPTEDLAFALQRLKTRKGLVKRICTAPVKQIAVETVRAEACQRGLARCNDSAARGMVREHLGYEEDFIPTPGDCLTDPRFRFSRSIELRGIDVSHPEVEPAAQCRDRRRGLSLLDEPGALADDRNLALG